VVAVRQNPLRERYLRGHTTDSCLYCTYLCLHDDGVQYSTMEGYHGAALLSELDAQARGGGGAAERLHASCRHLVAEAEVESKLVESRKRGAAALTDCTPSPSPRSSSGG
jgi:hypothetical protein